MKTWIPVLALVTVACRSTDSSSSRADAAQQATPDVSTAVEVVPLKFAVADQLASELRSVIDGQKSRRSMRVVADARTNSIIVSGPREDIAQLLELVAKLDVKQP